jgi:hypothetical protein
VRESHRPAPVVAAAALAVLTGCGDSPRDAGLKAVFEDGVVSIRATQDYEQLRSRLRRTIAGLRSTRDGKKRALAIRGFEATLRGVQSRINFHENDRGNIRAATRDARRANARLARGAALLRAAGRLLDVRVGTLNGY